MAESPRVASALRSRGASALRGWRFELLLALPCPIAFHELDARVGDGGIVLVTGFLAILLWRQPRIRVRLLQQLGTASTARAFTRGLRRSGITRRFGAEPRVRAVSRTPAGELLALAMPRGTAPAHLDGFIPHLAAALRVPEVRLFQDPRDASIAWVEVRRRDPLATPEPLPWPWASASGALLWQSIPIGIEESGATATLRLPERNLLLGGEPGSGKSSLLQLLVAAAALDSTVELTLLDGKQVELAPWRRVARRFVGPDPAAALDALGELGDELNERYEVLLAHSRRKVQPNDGLGLRLVVVDELAVFLNGGKRDERAEIERRFRDLVSRGRAAGLIVVAATQRPSHDVVPTSIRDLFSFRVAMRCTTKEASDTVLGQGWSAAGYSASNIDPAMRGVGLLLHEGGVPQRIRAYYLDDAEISGVAQRAEELRR